MLSQGGLLHRSRDWRVQVQGRVMVVVGRMSDASKMSQKIAQMLLFSDVTRGELPSTIEETPGVTFHRGHGVEREEMLSAVAEHSMYNNRTVKNEQNSLHQWPSQVLYERNIS